jgi:hypothetical protein
MREREIEREREGRGEIYREREGGGRRRGAVVAAAVLAFGGLDSTSRELPQLFVSLDVHMSQCARESVYVRVCVCVCVCVQPRLDLNRVESRVAHQTLTAQRSAIEDDSCPTALQQRDQVRRVKTSLLKRCAQTQTQPPAGKCVGVVRVHVNQRLAQTQTTQYTVHSI